MAHRLAVAARERGAQRTARRFDDREHDAAQRAGVIRSAILSLTDLDEMPRPGEPEPVGSEEDAMRPSAHDAVVDLETVRARPAEERAAATATRADGRRHGS